MTCRNASTISNDCATGGKFDESAFTTALADMRPDLYRWAWSLAHDQARADDLVQGTIERALRARGRFRGGSSLPAWLSSILRNLFFDGYRKERAYVSADFRDVAAEPVDHEIQPWDLLEYRDLWEATSVLPPQQRVDL